jgi:succinoglycan biosynthesis protein ExoA
MKPVVALLVAMRNEARYIEKCLASILAQDYPSDRLEIWVMDGESSDGSFAIVERLFNGRPNCHLVNNKRRIQSAAWNLGIQYSTAEIIGIVSAHTELASDYVSTAAETILRTGADMVGGPARAFGITSVGKAVALATSCPFGVGGARFHYTESEEDVDTVFMGLCWRNLYAEIGGFDEELVRDQDDELSYRILSMGGRIVCNPAIRSWYYNRSTLRSLWRQYFQYGLWKVRVMQKHSRQMRPRHFVPSAFMLGLFACWISASVGGSWVYLWIVYLGVYFLTNLSASFWALRKHQNLKLLPVISLSFLILHVSYGCGFLIGLMKFAGRWKEVNGTPGVSASDVTNFEAGN